MGEWKIIPIAPDYEVSSHGQVRRRTASVGTYAGRIMSPVPGEHGHLRVGLIVDGALRKFQVHRLVCLAFHGEAPSEQHVAAHRNGDPADNRVENVRWATQKENIADISVYGPPRAEERASHRKLSREAVAEIRATPKTYGFATRLAGKFGVSTSCIAAIRDRSRGLWPSVPFAEAV